jgi:MFS family permease
MDGTDSPKTGLGQHAEITRRRILGAAAGIAGLGFAAMQVAGSAGRVGAGSLTDRLMVWMGWSQARAAAAVLAGQALAGAALLAGLVFVTDGLVVLALLVGVGVTIAGFTGVYYACLTALVDEGEIGTATAGGQTALNAGALVAPPAFGWLADGLGYDAGWTLLAGIAVLGAVLAGLVFRRADRTPPRPEI